MKKILAMIIALTLALSLAVCAGAEPVSKDYTPEQMAVAEKFADMSARFNVLAEKINADANLQTVPQLVDIMNLMIDAANEDDALFSDPANLTPEVLSNLEQSVAAGNGFLDEIEAMLANYGGKQTITVPVAIVNDTDADIYTLAMSPSNDESWGGNLLDTPLLVGESGMTEMTFTEDTLVWDLLASDSQDSTLVFEGIDFSVAPIGGTTLMLTTMDGGYIAVFAQG